MNPKPLEIKWEIHPRLDPEDILSLSKALNVDVILAELLVHKGITTLDEAKAFFRPSLNDLHDPFLLKGMREAVALIEEMIIQNHKILIYGDYDVDGTTAVSLLYTYLGQFYSKLGYYIPDRHSEGYGLSLQAIDWAHEQGYKLIITLDCGITAVEPVEYAIQKGIEVIITDHHLPGEILPDAAAVIDPKQSDCYYPYKELSGCGIGFKLAQAFAISNNVELQPLYAMLDLLAVSIASDIVPITGENRILAYYGLKKLGENPSIGLKAIKDICCNKSDITISDIVFNIGPRINAAGRMGDAKNAVRLLISKNQIEAESIAASIDVTNAERKDIDTTITQEAFEMVRQNAKHPELSSTVVYNSNWHKGVIGIVASRLIESYYRPTIVFTQQDDLFTGSARSVSGFDIYQAILGCGDIVEQFGGHKYAAGLSIKANRIDEFIEKFDQVVKSHLKNDTLIPKIEIDIPLQVSHINDKFYRILKQFAPFGPGNMQPVFVAHDLYGGARTKIVGDNHLMLYIKEENSQEFQAIAFKQGQHYDDIIRGKQFSACYTIEENTWNGKTSLKINVKDIKIEK